MLPLVPLPDRMRKADALLVPYAVKHSNGLGRAVDEPQDETRFPFQHDRDRIIHTQSFRRLKHKTQVFVSGHGDHYRTRITHTLEVAQVSRNLARTLGLNEDLAEAIALAHDLGHTPFGHAGEEAMNTCMEPYGKTFEHNQQSLRVVSVLEVHSDGFLGLNLHREVLEGLTKHRTPHDVPTQEKALASGLPRAPSLEAQLVNLADEIAYTAHDIDDGLRAGLFTIDDLKQVQLARLARERAKQRATEIRGSVVYLLVTDLYETIPQLLSAHTIETLDDVYAAKQPLVAFSSSMQEMASELRAFFWKRMYGSPAVSEQAQRGRTIITELFDAYIKIPPAKVRTLQERSGGTLEDAVKDYIAGMTDTYAKSQWDAL